MSNIRIERLELTLPRKLAGSKTACHTLAISLARQLAGELSVGVAGVAATPPLSSIAVHVSRRETDPAGIVRAIRAGIREGATGRKGA
jgi:hypothetical protein